MLKVIGGFVGKIFAGSGNAGGIGVLVIVAAAGIFGYSFANLRADKKELKAKVQSLTEDLQNKESAWNGKYRILEDEKKALSRRVASDSIKHIESVHSFQMTIKVINASLKKTQAEKDTCGVNLTRVLDGVLCREKNFWGKLTGKLVPCK
jgi:response regulator RpfG family c-di-GMP phosphodiesterase